MHQPVAGGIFSVAQLKSVSGRAQLCRQAKSETYRLRTSMSLDWNHRPSVADRHDRLLDRGLERVVEGGDDPVRVLCGQNEFGRRRIAGAPELYGITVGCVTNAENFSARISSIPLSADSL